MRAILRWPVRLQLRRQLPQPVLVRTRLVFPVLFAVLSVGALTACGSGGPAAAPPSTGAPSTLSQDQAIDAAVQQATHIIQDSAVQQASARFTTYAGALAEADLHPSAGLRPDDTLVWLVRLKGLFYEPSPPSVPPSEQPACSQLTVLIDDSGQLITLVLAPAEDCS